MTRLAPLFALSAALTTGCFFTEEDTPFIEADDVRCTHGATAGRVDDEQVLYCMCRGLSRYEAMHLIVEGFFAGVYDRIPVELVRETLSAAVERKLGIGE